MESTRILIADDDKKTRDFVAAFLSYKGYHVFQASDGQDALEKIELNDVHLVITDIMMPRINGLEFIKKLKAMRPEIVTIAYSAFANSEMTANLLKAGAFFLPRKTVQSRRTGNPCKAGTGASGSAEPEFSDETVHQEPLPAQQYHR